MSAAPSWERERLERARTRMRAHDIDGVIVTPGSDLRYMAGYDAPALSRLTCLVVTAVGDTLLVVPRLEVEKARHSGAGAAGVEIRGWDETEDPAMIAAAVLPGAASKVALSGRTWFDHALNLQRALGEVALVSAAPVLAALRMRKSPAEVEALRAASAASDRAFAALQSGAVPVLGRSEAEIHRDVKDLLRSAGHVDGGGNVAAGANASSPHHAPGQRTVAEGDVLLIDVAGEMPDGYRSDCTRMFAVGEAPDREFVDYLAVVDAANGAAFAAARAGVAAEEIDRAARRVIVEAGYGPAFVHRVGHGIGLDVHESPFLVEGDSQPLEIGMCFTIEPGIYLPGRHGARIEDVVTIGPDGAERLNRTSHELAVLTS